MNAQDRKDAVSDLKGAHLLRLSDARHTDRIAGIQAHLLKRAALFAIDEVVGGRTIEFLQINTRRRVPYAHKLFRMKIAQRFEQNTLENAENHRIGSDGGGERDQRDDRKQRRTREPAEKLSQVIDQRPHARCSLIGTVLRARIVLAGGSPQNTLARGPKFRGNAKR